ncbi:MAG: methyltransferase domain-containing protein, partial [Alphaproteobacteria bacterium]
MANPLAKFKDKIPTNVVPRAKRLVFGLAHDFWKDGKAAVVDAPPPVSEQRMKRSLSALREESQKIIAEAVPASPPPPWHAEPGMISEKMWGEGFVSPADAEVSEMLIKPLNLTNAMDVLDISAGLGGRMRMISEKYGVAITGLEPDPEVAGRGMELSIKAGKGKYDAIATYDPANFSLAKKYDCILARENFYRVEDKNTFFAALAGCTKPQAQISFTDYVINPEDRDKSAIKAWQASEAGATPLSMVEMAEAWAKVGFTLSVHEDQTDLYKKEVTAGLKRL